MKKTTLGLAVLTLLFTACSKDDKGDDTMCFSGTRIWS